MDYPRAFVFINGDEDMPPLASVRKWFGSKSSSDVYVQGQSPVDEELDLAIKIISHIRCFSNDWSNNLEHCIVASITQVSLLAQTGLSERWCGISWMDSQSHGESQGVLSEAISGIVDLEEKFIEIEQCYAGLTDYVLKKTGQSMVSEPDLNRVLSGRHFSAQTEVEAHLKVIAKNETRSGVLWRIDLEDDSTTTQAA
jgi:hypothetical protein